MSRSSAAARRRPRRWSTAACRSQGRTAGRQPGQPPGGRRPRSPGCWRQRSAARPAAPPGVRPPASVTTRYFRRAPRYVTRCTTTLATVAPSALPPPPGPRSAMASWRRAMGAPLPVRPGHAGRERDRRPVVRPEDRRRAVGRMYQPFQKVAVADELGDERGGRTLVDRLRSTDLLHPARVHDDDAVGEAQGLLLVVSHEDGGDAQRPLESLAAPPASSGGVERRGWTAAC